MSPAGSRVPAAAAATDALSPAGAVAPAVPDARPLSLRLREDTRAAHESVERAASFNRLVVVRVPEAAPEASPADARRRERALAEYREVYRRFLVAAHGFEAGADRRVAESPALAEARAAGYAPEPMDPVARIREDLARVFGPGALGGLAAMDGLPPLGSVPALAGLEYVRRGSRMGGAVIGAVVRHNLGLDAATGAGFLGHYGNDTRRVVTGYKAWLDGLALDERGMREAVATAVATFAAVERWHLALERGFERG